jgi:hypothetical protein
MYIWLAIIAAILLAWWLWSQYGQLYRVYSDNPLVVGAAQSAARYTTDITGLINAYEAAQQDNGTFTSRLATFIGVLPK